MNDLETLIEIYEGHGFSTVLADAGSFAGTFDDARLNEAYSLIAEKVSEIHRIYAELGGE